MCLIYIQRKSTGNAMTLKIRLITNVLKKYTDVYKINTFIFN